MPKVSICIPAYKNPGGIKRLLASVIGQTYTDYEVIITDDSPDDSVKCAVEESGIPNIKYYRNEERLGATANWNAAVGHAEGEYIKIMHHDDWFSKETSLEEFVAMLEEHPDADLAFSGTFQVTLAEDGTETTDRFSRCISKEHCSLIEEDWHNLFLGGYIGAPSATIYRNKAILYEERLKWLVDVEFYMRLLRGNPKFIQTKAPLICIGISKNQLTEECNGDGRLNMFEYGFLYCEFSLQDDKRYREKMIWVALHYKMPYSALKPYGIHAGEYYKSFMIKQWKDILFLMTVAKKKIARKFRTA